MIKEEIKTIIKSGKPEEIKSALCSYWKKRFSENEQTIMAKEIFEIEAKIGT